MVALTVTRPNTGPPEFLVYPIGTGTPRTLDRGGLHLVNGVGSVAFIDDRRIIFRARATASGPFRTYIQSTDGGAPRLVAHEPGGITSGVAPDGDRFISSRDDNSVWLSSISGKTRASRESFRSVSGTIGDGRSTAHGLCVRQTSSQLDVVRIDVATGRETIVTTHAECAIGAGAVLRGIGDARRSRRLSSASGCRSTLYSSGRE